MYGHGSFWKIVNCRLPSLFVCQPVGNLFFCCEVSEIQFVQSCHTQAELQQLHLTVSQEPSSSNISLEELKFINGGRIVFLRLGALMGCRTFQVSIVIQEVAVHGRAASR